MPTEDSGLHKFKAYIGTVSYKAIDRDFDTFVFSGARSESLPDLPERLSALQNGLRLIEPRPLPIFPTEITDYYREGNGVLRSRFPEGLTVVISNVGISTIVYSEGSVSVKVRIYMGAAIFSSWQFATTYIDAKEGIHEVLKDARRVSEWAFGEDKPPSGFDTLSHGLMTPDEDISFYFRDANRLHKEIIDEVSDLEKFPRPPSRNFEP